MYIYVYLLYIHIVIGIFTDTLEGQSYQNIHTDMSRPTDTQTQTHRQCVAVCCSVLQTYPPNNAPPF